MNTEPTRRTSSRYLGVLACTAALLFAVSCASSDPAEPIEPAATALQPSTGESLVPQYDSYRLSYSSTCGDGPFFTGGTEIEVIDGEVLVIAGEAPFSVGSLAEWNRFAQAVADEGRVPGIELSPDGSLKSLTVGGRGIDDEFCVNVSAFEDLS